MGTPPFPLELRLRLVQEVLDSLGLELNLDEASLKQGQNFRHQSTHLFVHRLPEAPEIHLSTRDHPSIAILRVDNDHEISLAINFHASTPAAFPELGDELREILQLVDRLCIIGNMVLREWQRHPPQPPKLPKRKKRGKKNRPM